MKVERNGVGRFDRDGFAVISQVASTQQCDALAAELTNRFKSQQDSALARIGGVRNLLQSSSLVTEFAVSERVKAILQAALGAEAFPVRSIFFDKTPESNWAVAWHQDLHIAVAEKIETPGFGPWSVKAGVPHVQPPREVLAQMVTLRLHLDDCGQSNGALWVIPGSHVAGILGDDGFARWKAKPSVVCEVPKGGALLMSPLLMHASSPAVTPSHRRVLHIEYAGCELPNGLRWFERT